LWRRRTPFLETGSRTSLADPELHPGGRALAPLPQTTGRSAD